MTVELVVPCYNEELVLKLFYESFSRVAASKPDYDFLLLFVDDGSRDNTLNIINELALNDKRISFLSFSRNFGKEAAMMAGLKNSRGDLVAILDADLQHPPEMLIDMISAIVDEGYDSSSARRVSRAGEPRIRSFFSRGFYKLINRMSQVEIVDGAVDFRLMTRGMVDAILSLPEVERFSKGIFAWVGFKTKWIEYVNVERAAGESKWSFWKLFKYAIDGIVAFTTAPLKIATYVGLICALASFIYLIVEIIRTLVSGISVPGYASTIVILLFIGGMIMMFLGIFGEYLSRMYMEAKRRPMYIVKTSKIAELKAVDPASPEERQ